ncbi:hypothetical protein E4T42_05281 [Aureobasidium subglaciale]|uniref:Acyltransferase 3 domain-containing protein n=1 Tax=Aureobasidium subglaciale (strain EXF-2481) TaxID=1043005 RepID=A0A074Y3P0_AURSE|nr:uncharacterized protein AUEXF2481DRAFT_43108 [Aureobasidium subglaciale EXF-2481]KAI5202225.1 hypothetical protein E4T38_05734 [Aureobasidium subglaciale]KAI5221159.1 hypothetical protein E4T40_05629 [Aureobasidium subglaciale]KAI5224421.1 hypothetical protein E4T41_05713 [Aureobasidium subglaciale]KAI5249557.1 hypothetical protein E4T42_05281 [Aureobasidium subglaciale]KAI5261030.1 hypothetical protein E4T46_05488 [Aureobasidium subglaciale]
MSSSSEDLLEKGPLEAQQPDPALLRISKKLVRCLRILKPSFLGRTKASPAKLRRTAYLDGMRGFAALMVYVLHHQLWAHEFMDRKLENAFGFNGEHYFAALPFVRNFITGGHYAVGIFFVVSGYVLSAKPLMCIQAGDFVLLGDNLGSSVFKRWFRLYIPIVVTTLGIVFMWHIFGISANLRPQRTLSAELYFWYNEFKSFTWILNSSPPIWFTYNPHTWTIPLEFKGSLVVYVALTAFARCTRTARLCCELALIFYFIWIVDGMYFALFAGGLFLCDLDLLAAKDELPAWMDRHLKPHSTIIFQVMLVASLYLGGVPSFSKEMADLRISPGWGLLSYLKPEAVFDYKWFYNFWAAIFLVASVPRVPSFKNFFETRFCQYLGRISFMFYLVHGPVMSTLGDRIYAAVGMQRANHALVAPHWIGRFPIPHWGPLGLELNFLLPHLIILPFTLWVGEVLTVLVDDPSVKFAAWLRKLTLPTTPIERPTLQQVEIHPEPVVVVDRE